MPVMFEHILLVVSVVFPVTNVFCMFCHFTQIASDTTFQSRRCSINLGVIKVSSYNAKSESNIGLSCIKYCMKRNKLWNHSHANNAARSDCHFFTPPDYTPSLEDPWRNCWRYCWLVMAKKKSNKGGKKTYDITETEMQEHLKGIHVDRLTDIVLEAYRAVKLNWLSQTTASNPNAYVCKWDVMVSAWCTRWADYIVSPPELPAGSLRVFHTAWTRSVASSMKLATLRLALFNSPSLGKSCPSLLPLIRELMASAGRSLRHFAEQSGGS